MNSKIEFVKKLYEDSFADEKLDLKKVSPLKIVYSVGDEKKLGKKLIKENKLGIVVFSGGAATRLNTGKAKGLLKIKYNNKSISIFEIFIIKLLNVYKKYNVYLNIYFMTSTENNNEIVSYFENNNYFGYPKDNIFFFKQDNLPILDKSGNIMYKNDMEILQGATGNGDVFKALLKNNVLDNIKSKNIEYLVFSTIDNIMLKLIDEDFFGYVISNGYSLASKSISKDSSDDKNWIFIKYNNKPYMLPSSYIDDSLYKDKDYREKNMTYHFIKTSLVEKFCNLDLKYHRNYKAYDYYDKNKHAIVKSKDKNSFKFEKYIFDAFYYADDMLLYSVNKDEFLPIKTSDDIKEVEEKLKSKKLEDLC